MKKTYWILLILAVVVLGCEKETEEDCEITNPENLKWFNGCSDFMVFDSIKISGIENSYVSIQVERDELNLNGEFKSFKIQNNPHITSAVETFNLSTWDCYCSDAIIPELEKQNTWTVQSGTVEIRIVREKSECDDTYVVDVVLKNAIYKDAENNQITIGYKEILTVWVNFLIG